MRLWPARLISSMRLNIFGKPCRCVPPNLAELVSGWKAALPCLANVGSGAKIDYTAHGDAVNLAARLEALNKVLGTTLCIGSGTAALAQTPLSSLGLVDIRSFGPREVFTLTSPS